VHDFTSDAGEAGVEARTGGVAADAGEGEDVIAIWSENPRFQGKLESPCGADWQSAVSRIGNPHAWCGRTVCRLPVGDTADWQSTLQGQRTGWRRWPRFENLSYEVVALKSELA